MKENEQEPKLVLRTFDVDGEYFNLSIFYNDNCTEIQDEDGNCLMTFTSNNIVKDKAGTHIGRVGYRSSEDPFGPGTFYYESAVVYEGQTMPVLSVQDHGDARFDLEVDIFKTVTKLTEAAAAASAT